MTDKPKTMYYTNKIGEPSFESVAGYNQCSQEWEKYHKEVVTELLETCKNLVSRGTYSEQKTSIFKQAHQAIAKAEGSQDEK